MGSEQSHARGTSVAINDMEIVQYNENDLNKLSNERPLPSYAKISKNRPKLLPEVEDTIKQFKSNSKITGEGKGTLLPTHELSKTPGLYYDGEWKNKTQNGRGVVRGANGTYLEAYFVNGKANGNGFHVYPDGSYYNGEFKEGVFSGRGRFFYKINRMVYDGQWRDGKPNGKGVEIFPGIGRYEGSFANGLKQGKGVMKWDDDREYEGEFHEGYMHGEGVLRKGDSKGYYKGRFEKNNKVGRIMKTATGTYEGPFVRGEMSGQGKFTWNNGNVYQGDFKFNKMHGNGSMTLKGQQAYTGKWENGLNVKID